MNMRVDLIGLVQNVQKQIEVPDVRWKAYYAGAMEELAKHLQQVKDNPELLPDFLDMYSIQEKPEATEE